MNGCEKYIQIICSNSRIGPSVLLINVWIGNSNIKEIHKENISYKNIFLESTLERLNPSMEICYMPMDLIWSYGQGYDNPFKNEEVGEWIKIATLFQSSGQVYPSPKHQDCGNS